MSICTVSIAGADDNVNPVDLVDISDRYPFVEWGILLSPDKMGSPRFPSLKWIKRLGEYKENLRLSGHLCGRWVSDMINGNLSFRAEHHDIWGMLKRIQLNFHGNFIPLSNNFMDAISLIHGKQIIFQIDDDTNKLFESAVNANLNVAPLFDSSHGTGTKPEHWPAPCQGVKCGYAGGLSPENLEEQIQKILKVSGDRRIWIDMESGVRTDNKFDIEKVERVLIIAEDYISPESRASSYLETDKGQEQIHNSVFPPSV
jgi:hypothetical protein